MRNGLQHLSFDTPNTHANSTRDFLVGETVDPAEQENFQRLGLELAQYGPVMLELLASFEFSMLIIFGWVVQAFDKRYRKFRKSRRGALGAVSQQIRSDAPKICLWRCNLGDRRCAQESGERFLCEIISLVI